MDLRRLQGLTGGSGFPAPAAAAPPGGKRLLTFGAFLTLLTAALVTALVIRGAGHPAPDAAPIGVAILPLEYEGPPDRTDLKDIVPLVLAETMRDSPSVRVAPFASSRTYSANASAESISRQLGVDWVIAGKLVTDGQVFTVSLHASSAGGGGATWSKTVEGRLSDIVALSTTHALELLRVVGAQTAESPSGPRGSNPAAMEAYLRGMTLLEGWDVQRNAAEAENAFREAIALDPEFAIAHAKLAVALLSRFSRTRDASTIGQAAAAAERSQSLAPSLPETNAAVGMVELQRGRSIAAAEAFEKALALAPADDALHRSVARAYADLGRDSDAEAMYQRAVDLRPSFWGNYNSWATFCLKRADWTRRSSCSGR